MAETKLNKAKRLLGWARQRARAAEAEATFLRSCLRDQTEKHQEERRTLKLELAQSREFYSVVNGRLARLQWKGPVRSPLDGQVYNTPESYAAHLTLHGKVIN